MTDKSGEVGFGNNAVFLAFLYVTVVLHCTNNNEMSLCLHRAWKYSLL